MLDLSVGFRSSKVMRVLRVNMVSSRVVNLLVISSECHSGDQSQGKEFH